MKELPQISEAEFEVMKVIWKHAPINTNEITDKLTHTTKWSPKTIQTLSQYHQLCWWFAITPPGSFVFPPKGGLTNRSFLLLVTA